MNSPKGTQPVRLQRKRTKGWNMQEESRKLNGLPATYVGRPTVWGNCIGTVEAYGEWLLSGIEGRPSHTGVFGAALDAITGYKRREEAVSALPELRGKNLVCWCSLSDECHADVLLELANKEVN